MLVENNRKLLLKVFLVYLVYFLYTYLAGYVISVFQIQNSSFVMFFADLFFLLLIIFAYRRELKEDIEKLKKDFPAKRIVKNVLLGILAVFLLKMVMGIITELVSPNLDLDGNTLAILELLKTSPVYVVFKTMIFASIAEEILFRKSLSGILKNDYVFIIVTSIIYTLMNFVFHSGAGIPFVDILMYFLSAIVLASIYIKNDRNIFIVMIVKFVIQCIPFIILLMG